MHNEWRIRVTYHFLQGDSCNCGFTPGVWTQIRARLTPRSTIRAWVCLVRYPLFLRTGSRYRWGVEATYLAEHKLCQRPLCQNKEMHGCRIRWTVAEHRKCKSWKSHYLVVVGISEVENSMHQLCCLTDIKDIHSADVSSGIAIVLNNTWCEEHW